MSDVDLTHVRVVRSDVKSSLSVLQGKIDEIIISGRAIFNDDDVIIICKYIWLKLLMYEFEVVDNGCEYYVHELSENCLKVVLSEVCDGDVTVYDVVHRESMNLSLSLGFVQVDKSNRVRASFGYYDDLADRLLSIAFVSDGNVEMLSELRSDDEYEFDQNLIEKLRTVLL